MYRVELKGFGGFCCFCEEGVPNVPCGVESRVAKAGGGKPCWCGFLMYRVELKVGLKMLLILTTPMVPNVPCGVERRATNPPAITGCEADVPNVPCGVESRFLGSGDVINSLFLMYRVELKVRMPSSTPLLSLSFVPNVPCGVERGLKIL